MKNKQISGSLNGIEITIEIPSDPKEGLSNRKELCEKCGMLFSFKNRPIITMKETEFPLDIIFLDEDYNVVDVQIGQPLQKDVITTNDLTAKHVLEVNYGFTNKFKVFDGDSLKLNKEELNLETKSKPSKEPNVLIKELKKGSYLGKHIKATMGDGQYERTKIQFIPTGYDPADRKFANTTKTSFSTKDYTGKDSKRDAQNKKLQKAKEGVKLEIFEKGKKIVNNILSRASKQGATMFLLDEEGNPQMPMKGGERIFSRRHTRQLLDLVKLEPSVENLITLGKKMAEIIKTQDTQKPEYVKD